MPSDDLVREYERVVAYGQAIVWKRYCRTFNYHTLKDLMQVAAMELWEWVLKNGQVPNVSFYKTVFRRVLSDVLRRRQNPNNPHFMPTNVMMGSYWRRQAIARNNINPIPHVVEAPSLGDGTRREMLGLWCRGLTQPQIARSLKTDQPWVSRQLAAAIKEFQ